LILISSIITITVQDSNATSKADKIREGAKDVKKDIEEGLDKLRAINNKYNDNQNIHNEFDNSEDTEDTSENNNDNDKISITDELRELAQLKKEGIITEEEFQEMKEDLID
jgi:hypothetical protein